jgi:hypothetical protein
MPVVEYLNKQNWTIITGFGNNFSRAPKVFYPIKPQILQAKKAPWKNQA